jgi:hypothetical protein
LASRGAADEPAGCSDGRAAKVRTEPQETDILLMFENEHFSSDFKEYYKAKRQNFFATIQSFSGLWDCFQRLDRIWMREFQDMNVVTDTNTMLPGMLFMNAHAKFRIALELGFSCCLGEAWDALRGAIESAAHGHKISREPAMLKVWLDKDHGKKEAEAFKHAFERNKKTSLFPPQGGLDKLHHFYSQYSEWGTHTTVGSMAQRFRSVRTGDGTEWRVNYTGADLKLLAVSLFSMLMASSLMEGGLFSVFKNRLQIDIGLATMRGELAQAIQESRAETINRFKIAPPNIWLVTF